VAWRVRSLLRFQPGSGMAAWGKAQADVRLTHDHDPNRQKANEEASRSVAIGNVLDVDMFVATEALAIDTFSTFTAGSITAWLRPNDESNVSFVDYHECFHDQDPPLPCSAPTRWEL